MRIISYFFTILGVLMALYGFIGRIAGAPTVSLFLPGYTLTATSLFVAGNTMLLLAILAVLYSRK